jgi:phospholipase/lecithinase/hemolysin
MTTKPFDKFENKIAGNLNGYVGKYLNQLTGEQIASPKQTIFLFWAGPNDFYHGGNSNEIIHNIQQEIERLAAAGAKHFAVLNTLDFSMSPCSECYRQTQILNSIWPEQWRRFSIPGANIILIDIENIHREIIKSDFGIKANSTQCFKGWWSKGSNNPTEDTCPQVGQSFFYDDVHPTTTAHCWLSFHIGSDILMRSHNEKELKKYRRICKTIQ